MSDAGATISIRGVTKCFGNVTAVDALDLEVPPGSLIGFLGPNGAGKSTTIRMIMSIIYADSGTVNVLGRSALDAKDRIGYLPEERGLYRRMRVRDFLRYLGRLKGMSRRDADAAAAGWLDRLELPEALGRRCEELSKGQQQKVQFVAAVLHDPDLLILDEPFTGLDPVNAQLLSAVIRELHDGGRTIVFSTHVLHQAEQLCNRIFLIHKGAKLLDDDLASIRQRFTRRIVTVEIDDRATLPAIPGTRAELIDRDVHRIDLHLDEGSEERTVMRSVLDAAAVRSVSLRQPSLDDIFTTLVTGEDAA